MPIMPSPVLPKHQAVEFTGAKVPLGSSVTSVKAVITTPQQDVPFTFGQVFKAGDLAPSDGLVGRIEGRADIPLQFDVKATHLDGSVAHGIVSGFTNFDKTSDIFLIRTAGKVKTHKPLSGITAKATLTFSGVKYTSEAPTTGMVWLSGDIVNEVIALSPLKTVDGAIHPDIEVRWYVRQYFNGVTKYDVAFEHTKLSATANSIYDVDVSINNVSQYSKLGLVHYWSARWMLTMWDNPTAVHIQHNSEYFVASKMVPNWDTKTVISERVLTSYGKSITDNLYGPMAVGRFAAAMGTTGGRPDIGISPDSYVAYIISGDKRAKDVMLASGRVAGSWSTHKRDANGKMISVVDRPNFGDNVDPFPVGKAGNPLAHDIAHQPAFAYIPYLVTGDYYYLEELQFWANFNAYATSPGYRDYSKGLIREAQLRGQAWTLRTLGQASIATPDDDPQKMNFRYWLDCNLDYYNRIYTDGPSTVVNESKQYNSIGIMTAGMYSVNYPMEGVSSVGCAPWQDDFFTQAIGHVAELGFAKADRLLKWKAKFPIERMTTPGYCWLDAATYKLRVRDTVTSPYYTTIQECYVKTMQPRVPGLVTTTEDIPARLEYIKSLTAALRSEFLLPMYPTEMSGYASMPTGYPSNMQPALAMAVDSGYPNGDKAWEVFQTCSPKPDYSSQPQFAIIPRRYNEAPPVVVLPLPAEPPVVVPPVVVIPPVVVPFARIEVINPEFINQTGLTLIVNSGVKSKVYLNVTGDEKGVINIQNFWLVLGVKYSCTVLDNSGYTIATIFPIKAI